MREINRAVQDDYLDEWEMDWDEVMDKNISFFLTSIRHSRTII